MRNRRQPRTNADPVDQRAHAHQPEAELLRRYGSHSLAFFGLAEDFEHFLAPEEQGLIAYRVVNRVAVVLGDPLCAPEAVAAVTRDFLAFCRARHWSVAFYQASPDYLAVYRTFHLCAFKMGEEAMLFPQTFTSQGPALAKVRTRCRHAQREGVQIQWYEGVLPAAVMQQLVSVSDAWLESKGGRQAEETGFSTGKCYEIQTNARRADRLTGLLIPSHSTLPALPLMTGVALTRTGQACAFVTFTPIYGVATGEEGTSQRWGWALDLMRRTADAPSGAMELLLVQALERFRARGAYRASLALVALADTRQEMAQPWRYLVDLAAGHMALFEQRQTLLRFKQKFAPCWESRYLVTSSRLALPNIALAVLRLRHYPGRGLVRRLAR